MTASSEYTGLLEVLSELSSMCSGGAFVSINNHPEFHQSTGNPMLTAMKVIELRKNAGVIVTDNHLMWKQTSGLTDRHYYSSNGESKLFYVLQKKLVVEMAMDVLSLDAQTIAELENACEGMSPLQFNEPISDACVSHLIVKLFDRKFAKELSQIGGITLDRDAFADYFRCSNGKQLWVDKLSYIVTHSDGTRERKTKFRVWRDYGNAVYASWMRWFLGQEQTYRIFSTDNEEKLGDGLETVLGFFDVISYFGNELPKWGNTDQCSKLRS